MHQASIAFRDLNKLRIALDEFRGNSDESVVKEFSKLSRHLRESEGNLEGVADTLTIGVRPKLGELTSPRAQFVSKLLQDIPEATTDNKKSNLLILQKFSLEFERYRSKEAVGASEEDEQVSLQKIQEELEDCDELCRLYADLFALLQQEITSSDAYTKRLIINDQSVLTDIIAREMAACEDTENEGLVAQNENDQGVPLNEVSLRKEDAWPEIPPLPAEEAASSTVSEKVIALEGKVETPLNSAEEVSSAEDDKRADVVFVIDASGSMRNCFEQLCVNIRKFIEPFQAQGFKSLRLGLLAYSANINRTTKQCVYRNIVIGGEGALAMKKLYGTIPSPEGLFFTNSLNEIVETETFMRRLEGVRCKGDEDTVFALDCAADFPFDSLESTRRVMVVFTDEKIEEGVLKEDSIGENFSLVEQVMKKIVDRHISLYLFAPESPVTEVISDFPRVFTTSVPAFRPGATDVWQGIDFVKILERIGTRVSCSLSGGNEQNFSRAIFGQNSWSDDRWA